MPEQTFFFYDLETSGRDCKRHRIMQFAGQRTDRELNPLGGPMNLVVRLDAEVIPEPMAVLITGITPQSTEGGISEREAVELIMREAFTPGTVAVGFNNVRFDDEFMRCAAYRNFHDPYEWHWQDGRGRWDLLDAVRLVRALRPEGIAWPVDGGGAPVNKLSFLAEANGLSVERAHDALSDVVSLIEVARLIREKQPKMSSYLLGCRGKAEAGAVADPARPRKFVYASGMYGGEAQFTTVAYPAGFGKNRCVVAYDLRRDPAAYAGMDLEALRKLRFMKKEEREARGLPPFPAKELHCNKCPAVAPYSALRDEDAVRLGLDKASIEANEASLKAGPLPGLLTSLFKEDRPYPPAEDVDGQLYDGFFEGGDKRAIAEVRAAGPQALGGRTFRFADPRLPKLLARYKARNAPETLAADEREEWELYRAARRERDLAELEASLAEIGPREGEEAELLEAVKEWSPRE